MAWDDAEEEFYKHQELAKKRAELLFFCRAYEFQVRRVECLVKELESAKEFLDSLSDWIAKNVNSDQ